MLIKRQKNDRMLFAVEDCGKQIRRGIASRQVTKSKDIRIHTTEKISSRFEDVKQTKTLFFIRRSSSSLFIVYVFDLPLNWFALLSFVIFGCCLE